MKKNLWVLGMAVAALTSCTQSEVLEIPESRAIGFNMHVDKNSRNALTDVNKTSIQEFHVFGYYREIPNLGQDTPTGDFVSLFNNTQVERTDAKAETWTYSGVKYWQTYTQYRFAAYANGLNEAHLSVDDADNVNKVAYDPTADAMIFTNYKAEGDNDLVAAITSDIITGASITSPEVPFSFDHMLSKIGFSFYGNTQTTLKISDVTINGACTTGNATYTYQTGADNKNLIAWTGLGGTTVYTSSSTENALGSSVTRYVFYVIPQANTNATVSFCLTTYDANGDKIDKTKYTANLQTTATNHVGVWKEGYVYEYYPLFPSSPPHYLSFLPTWQLASLRTSDPEKGRRKW